MSWLGDGHLLAGVARRRCTAVHPGLAGHALIGRVACGRCWEEAIRTDARVAAEFELPAETPEPDLSYVDPIAVERALAGERVRLTRTERAELARRAYAGEVPWRVVERLGISGSTAQDLLRTTPRAPRRRPVAAVAS